jgi:WD40 repeat protein
MLSILAICLAAAPVPAEDWTPRTFRVGKPKGAEQGAAAVAISADGKLVAAAFNGLGPGAGGTRGSVRVWEVETGKQVMGVGAQGEFLKVAIGPDGKSVVWCRMFAALDGPDYNRVFVRGFGDKLLTRTHNSQYGASFAFSADGRRFAIGVADRVELRDGAGDTKLAELKGFPPGYAFAFTPDGKQLAGVRVVDGKEHWEYHLVRCETDSGKLVAESERLTEPVYAVALSHDGKHAATGHPDGVVKVWDEKWKVVKTLATKAKGRAHPFFSSDGKFLAAGDQTTGEVVVWDRATDTEVRRFVFEDGNFRGALSPYVGSRFVPERDPMRFAFTPGGKTLLVGCNGVQLVSVAEGKLIRTFNLE